MLKSKNIFLYSAIAIFIVFTAIYFIVVNKVSYAFSYSTEDSLYESKLNSIKQIAILYAENNEDIFSEDQIIYITVNDLIKNNILLPDTEDGKIINPHSEDKYLNDIKIRLTLKDGKVNAKILF